MNPRPSCHMISNFFYSFFSWNKNPIYTSPCFFFKKQKLSQLTVHNKMSCKESAIQFLHMLPILDKISLNISEKLIKKKVSTQDYHPN